MRILALSWKFSQIIRILYFAKVFVRLFFVDRIFTKKWSLSRWICWKRFIWSWNDSFQNSILVFKGLTMLIKIFNIYFQRFQLFYQNFFLIISFSSAIISLKSGRNLSLITCWWRLTKILIDILYYFKKDSRHQTLKNDYRKLWN